MNTHTHLEEFLQRDLAAIEQKISTMAAVVDRVLIAGVEALTKNDRQKAYSVILRDQYIDEMETEVDRVCLEFLVRHQPVAGHLRFVFAAIQINRELERVGDFAESIARQALALSRLEPRPDYTRFVELSDLARHMLSDAIQAFITRDADLARRTSVIEERANSLRNAINADVARLEKSGGINPSAVHPLRTVARRLEGVSDQAKHICEEATYMCTGQFVRHKGADTFRITFIDQSNSTLSQLAEAAAKSMNLPRFQFASAGLGAHPVHPGVIAFLDKKGYSLSPQASKTLDQVPDWQFSNVVITLRVELPDRLPDSSKAIQIAWNVAEDISPDASPAEAEQQAAAAYSLIASQIEELVGAVLDEVPHH